MVKILQINTTVNWNSTGRIAEDIGILIQSKGWKSFIAYSRGKTNSKSDLIHVGNKWDVYKHGIQTRILDNHGLGSTKATIDFIKKIKCIKPDIIHLHNIHGYYLNYQILFEYISSVNIPVVWTLHDCWSFTGHCSYYTYKKCERWKNKCNQCPQKNSYPASYFLDRSEKNYYEKKNSFTSVRNMTIVPVSNWLATDVKESFLCKYPIQVIHNGIDLNTFSPIKSKRQNVNSKMEFIILGVASVWEERKGLKDFLKLRQLLPDNYSIILIGLTRKQIKRLPRNIIGLERTNSVQELAQYYSNANVFLNPTWEDNFPTTNLEALACGTPVITYRTGGSIEAIDDKTGVIVEQGSIKELAEKTQWMCNRSDFEQVRIDCRKRAVELFDKNNRYEDYYQLYMNLLNNKNENKL